ncbi:MAG: hypothetical protein NZM28_10755 [Fimbriimonadales bacterium]|nr:hypothetical protein [Fimbriimonadales bacterium]
MDVDSTLQDVLPQQPRWDYVIGVRCEGQEHAIWVECHPAHTSNVEEVLAKLQWLKSWLAQEAAELKKLTPEGGFYWISTDGCQIQPDSRHAFRLLKAGLRLPRKVLNLDALDL